MNTEWQARLRLGNDVLSDRGLVTRLQALAEAGLLSGLETYLAGAGLDAWRTFADQAERVDTAHVAAHRLALANPETQTLTAADLDPFAPDADQLAEDAADAERGRADLAKGDWAVLVFAGGSGTRFFSEWDKLSQALPVPTEALREAPPEREAPKGCFPITCVAGLTFYQQIAATLLAEGVACGKLAPLCLMTSSNTHAHTERWIAADPLWGYPKAAMIVFLQHEIPRLDEHGTLIAQPDGRLFWTGNGHGGVYAALADAAGGVSPLERLRQSGVRHVVMGNVDNAELSPLAPARLGYHARTGSHFTMTVVKRARPDEKVGVVCRRKRDGRVEVIEYSVLDPALAAAADEKGELRFAAAHINTNLVDLSVWSSRLPGTLYTGKPISVAGTPVKSSTFERLNQHLAGVLDPERVHVYQAPRDGYFSPTKAIVGVDSVSSTFRAQAAREAACLRRLGATVAGTEAEPAAFVELNPAVGLTDDEKRARGIGRGWVLEEGSRLYLCARHGEDGPTISEGLHLEAGAQLIVTVRQPYGKLAYDPATRAIREDVPSAGRLVMGKNIRIEAGVRVVIDIDGDGRIYVPDNSVFPKNQGAHVAAGGRLTLRA